MKPLLPQATIDKIKTTLENQRKQIEKQLQGLHKEDPFMQDDRSRVDEPGSTSLEEDGHTRVAAAIKESERLLAQVKKALSRMGLGKYGICESCGQPIDPKRLEAFPMATFCMECETKKAK